MRGKFEALPFAAAARLEYSGRRAAEGRLDEVADGRRERLLERLDDLAAARAVRGALREEEAHVRAQLAAPLYQRLLRDGVARQTVGRE
eukprot:6925352-Prymnesium_polylepis.1